MNFRHPLVLPLGLFLLGAPFRGGQWVSLPWVIVSALLVFDALAPEWYRVPAWLRRPWLGVAASAIYLVNAISFDKWTFGGVLWLVATGLFLFDSWKRREPHLLSDTLRVTAESSAASSQSGTGSRRKVYVALGLFAAAWLLSNVGDNPTAPRLGVLWLIVTAIVLAQTVRPELAARFPAWLRRPTLGAVASAVYLLTTLALVAFTPTGLLWLAATIVFIRDAAERGELQPFDPRLLWRGNARRAIFVGGALVAMSLTLTWDNNYRTSGYDRSHTSTSTHYDTTRGVDVQVETTTHQWVAGGSFGGNLSAHDLGAGLPTWALLATALALSWNGSRRVWLPIVPLATAGLLGAWSMKQLIENRLSATQFTGSSVFTTEAEGPWALLLFLVPFTVGAVLVVREALAGPAALPASTQGESTSVTGA
ncbi:MAG: hypothetical protein ACJ8AT_12115 [Hyalangium sp.]|uniref:hypothetical protein n=1 Tax=Hyalangium sp. TaxID=2028555 RepID=UPI00389AB0F1